MARILEAKIQIETKSNTLIIRENKETLEIHGIPFSFRNYYDKNIKG